MAKLNPYLHFKNNAREAMEFYKSIFGGELTVSTFKDGGMAHSESDNDMLMHAMLIVGPEMTIMAADTPSGMQFTEGSRIEMSLSGESTDEDKLKGYWDKLSEGANVFMPLNKAPWGDMFGMLTDKFGIGWMVNIAGKKE